MKKYILVLVAVFALVGCGGTKEPETTEPDTNSSASVSDDATVIRASLGANGNWITAATADLTFTDDLVVEGVFHDKGEEANEVYRKLALYTQDDDRKVTGTFVLTTPKLIVRSENFTIFYGTVVGDVYVEADGFALVGAKIDGNVVFASDAYKNSAVLDKGDEGAVITGSVTVDE